MLGVILSLAYLTNRPQPFCYGWTGCQGAFNHLP